MLQHADPAPSSAENETRDAFRHEVDQIIAQRLEGSTLRKPRGTEEEDDEAFESASRRPSVASRAASIDHSIFDTPDIKSAVPEPQYMPDADEAETEVWEDSPLDYAPVEAIAEPAPPPRPPELRQEESWQEDLRREELDQEEDLRLEVRPEDEQHQEDRRKEDRRQGERRNVEFLRTELQWSSTPDSDEKRGLFGKIGFKPSRMALLAVAVLSAVIAGGLALTNAPQPPAPVPEPVAPEPVKPVEVPTTRILIATEQIGAGQKLTETSIGWHEVPVSTLMPGYISAEDDPEAVTAFDQSIARYAFFPGDPIRTDKLLDSPHNSLATVLSSGMRGISVTVNAGTAAGGFIKPDDHVDVVLTSNNTTRTVLQDVRVLAIGNAFGPSTTGEVAEDPAAVDKGFKGATTAILELDPTASEVLVKSATSGVLTLTLRPQEDTAKAEAGQRSGANQAIRLTSAFWNEKYSPAAE